MRWFDRGAAELLATLFVGEVVIFGYLVGHGPSPAALAFFVAVVAALVALALRAPRYLLSVKPGARRVGRNVWVLLGYDRVRGLHSRSLLLVHMAHFRVRSRLLLGYR